MSFTCAAEILTNDKEDLRKIFNHLTIVHRSVYQKQESTQQEEKGYQVMLLITPYPRLVSPLLATKSTPESSFTRRARASSSSSSSSSYHWPFLTPKRRLNGFKLKSATVPGDVESGSLVKGLKLGGMFGVWYLLNIYYNIFNKQVLSIFDSIVFSSWVTIGFWLLNLFVQPGA